MNLKRNAIISLLLCFLVLVSVFATSCGGDQADESKDASDASKSDTSAAANNGWDAEANKYVVDLPNIDDEFGADKPKEINFLIMNQATSTTTYFSEEIVPDLYDTTDEMLNDAVTRRNDLIEEQYGVTIKAKPVDDVTGYLRDSITADTEKFDVAMPYMPGASKLAQDGLIYDLNEFSQYLNFEKAWWDQNATQSLSINNKLYFTTGDISIMQKIVSVAMIFNKKVLENNYPDVDLYQMVRDKEWTFDKVYEMAKAVTSDADDDGVLTYKDVWGMGGANGDANMFYLASGEKFVAKDVNDFPVLALGQSAGNTNIISSIMEKMIETGWITYAEDYKNDVSDIWSTALSVFGENRCLFRTSAFSAIKKLRQFDDCEYGILPMPLITASQETYYTPCSAHYAFGVVIPSNAPNPEFSAYMLEVMSCEAKNTITEAYYGTILKTRDVQDVDSEEMLDEYIFSNVVYDNGYIHDIGQISSLLVNLKNAKQTSIASIMEENAPVLNKAINDIIASFS